jgi:hypothetical protein
VTTRAQSEGNFANYHPRILSHPESLFWPGIRRRRQWPEPEGDWGSSPPTAKGFAQLPSTRMESSRQAGTPLQRNRAAGRGALAKLYSIQGGVLGDRGTTNYLSSC